MLARRDERIFRKEDLCLLGTMTVRRLTGNIRCVIAFHRFCQQGISYSFECA